MTKSLNLWLVNIVLSAFFMSCDDKNDAGIDLQPDSSILTTAVIDTFTVNFSTVYEKEGINSSDSKVLLTGAYVDTYLGAVETASYFQMVPETENSLGDNFICDSVVLNLKYTYNSSTDADGAETKIYHYYGDLNSSIDLEVYQVTEDFESVDIKEYSTLDELATSSIKEGSSGENILDPEADGSLKINLDKSSYGQLALDNYSDNHDTFLSQIKGLMLKAADGTDALCVGFKTNTDETYIDIYYHNNTNDGLTIRLIISDAARRFNHIEGELTATVLSGLTNAGDVVSSTTTDNKMYLQSSTGVRTLLEVPYLRNFIDENPGILINKVELILPIDKTTVIDGTSDAPPIDISLHIATDENLLDRDSDGDLSFISNEGDETGTDKGKAYYPYDDEEQHYLINLGLYTQYFAQNSTSDFQIIISPYGEGIYVNRAILLNTEATGDKASFKFYYTTRQR
jgi:hypothetical protein